MCAVENNLKLSSEMMRPPEMAPRFRIMRMYDAMSCGVDAMDPAANSTAKFPAGTIGPWRG